jgi:hypothetical protein
MNEIDYFKVFILYSGDVTIDVNHLHIKRIDLVNFSYIVIDDMTLKSWSCSMYSSRTWDFSQIYYA